MRIEIDHPSIAIVVDVGTAEEDSSHSRPVVVATTTMIVLRRVFRRVERAGPTVAQCFRVESREAPHGHCWIVAERGDRCHDCRVEEEVLAVAVDPAAGVAHTADCLVVVDAVAAAVVVGTEEDGEGHHLPSNLVETVATRDEALVERAVLLDWDFGRRECRGVAAVLLLGWDLVALLLLVLANDHCH